jgi:hypothetical protein
VLTKLAQLRLAGQILRLQRGDPMTKLAILGLLGKGAYHGTMGTAGLVGAAATNPAAAMTVGMGGLIVGGGAVAAKKQFKQGVQQTAPQVQAARVYRAPYGHEGGMF